MRRGRGTSRVPVGVLSSAPSSVRSPVVSPTLPPQRCQSLVGSAPRSRQRCRRRHCRHRACPPCDTTANREQEQCRSVPPPAGDAKPVMPPKPRRAQVKARSRPRRAQGASATGRHRASRVAESHDRNPGHPDSAGRQCTGPTLAGQRALAPRPGTDPHEGGALVDNPEAGCFCGRSRDFTVAGLRSPAASRGQENRRG